MDQFESVTDEAFSYLVSEFGYSARPPERGDRFGLAMIRRFVKGDVTVSFVFGGDSTHLCSVYFDDGANAEIRHCYMPRALSILLRDRLPGYVHRTSRDLTDDDSIVDAIREYGALLAEHGADAIGGDFAAFPELVYLLIYVEEPESGQDMGRPIGLFSSLELVEKARKNRRKAMKHLERPDGYQIWRMDIDPRFLIRPADFGLPEA